MLDFDLMFKISDKIKRQNQVLGNLFEDHVISDGKMCLLVYYCWR